MKLGKILVLLSVCTYINFFINISCNYKLNITVLTNQTLKYEIRYSFSNILKLL